MTLWHIWANCWGTLAALTVTLVIALFVRGWWIEKQKLRHRRHVEAVLHILSEGELK